ncbi:MAG: PEGA domain-containing protein [Fibromonadaceae bacterium]|nr:PEGA domain-containing protein [Fibromonadaceae bacterium]
MNLKFKLFTVFFLLLTASVWAGKWTIDGFDDSPDPGDPDKFIDGDLNPVPPGQVSQQSNTLYVRQKFEDTFGDEGATYQIFKGRPTAEAKTLGKISLDGIPYGNLLKMKLFYKKNATGDDDLETVYFDGKDILVEGSDPVYINLNGKMEELKPVVLLDFKVSITSEPAGATVTVGGANKGVTPVTINLSSQKTVTAIITKDGYYTVIKPITPSTKQTVQEGVSLIARKSLDNPATAYKAKFQTVGSDKNAIKNLRADVKKTLDNYNSDSKKSIDKVMEKYPQNPPKASEESSNDYSTRQALYNNTQAKERETLNKEALGIFNELKDLLAEIDASSGGMDFALKYEYIPSNAISIVNMGVRDFTINAGVQNSRVKFNYSKAKLAYGDVSRDEIEENQENVHGVLKIWDNPNEKGKYASIYDIAFFFDETPLKILSKGSFDLSEATSKSKDTEKDLNSRVAKHPGKAEWDKKDEAATLKALRTGEIPDPYAVAKKAPPPPKPKQKQVEEDDDDDDADYDEDEDEDEIEEGVAAQEKYDYSRYGASGNATQIFGHTDEILFWTGMAFLASAIANGVVGYWKNQMPWKEANEAVKNTKTAIEDIKTQIIGTCAQDFPESPDCADRVIKYAEGRDPDTGRPVEVNNEVTEGRPLYILNKHLDHNNQVLDSYNKGRIIFFSAAAVSAAISITLFAW